jgi:uncharacterized membrane protein
MLWITGTGFLLAWFVAKFGFGKGGFFHILLMVALNLFVIQFVQDRRTKAYFREQEGEDN